jgi:pre-mRNA 3'-end-processing factor FIP1
MGLMFYRQSRYNTIQNINQRNIASDVTAKLSTIKKETPVKGTPPGLGTDLPGLSTSKIDVDAKPIYQPAGKPITQVNIDEGIYSKFYRNNS